MTRGGGGKMILNFEDELDESIKKITSVSFLLSFDYCCIGASFSTFLFIGIDRLCRNSIRRVAMPRGAAILDMASLSVVLTKQHLSRSLSLDEAML